MSTTAATYDLIVSTQGTTELTALQKQVQKFTSEMQTAQKAAGGFGKPANDVGRASAAMGAQLKNASFQIQDVAVQIASGTAASRALAQQLPQLLSGFGVFGAVAGTVAAVFIPLASSMLGFGQDVKSAGEQADAASEQIGKLNDALKRSSDDFNNAGIQAGAYSDQLNRLNQQRVGVELAKSQVELRAAIAAVGTEIKGQLGALDAWQISNGNVGQVLSQVSKEVLSAEGGFTRFRGALIATTERARDITALAGGLQEIGLNANLAFTEARKLYDALASNNVAVAATEFDRLSALIQKYGMATDESRATSVGLLDLLSKLSGAAIDYQRNLAVAIERQQKLFSSVGSYGPSTATSGTTIAPEPTAEQRKAMAEADAAARKAASEYAAFIQTIERGNTPLQAAQAQLKEAAANLERFGAQMTPEQKAAAEAYLTSINTKIDELTFKDRWEEMAKGIQSVSTPLSVLFDQLTQVGKAVEESFAGGLTDAFMAFIDGTKSAQAAFKEFAVSFLKEITAMIIKSLILYAIQAAFGMAGGGISGLLGGASLNPMQNAKGNAFQNGKLVAFASGGIVNGPTTFPMAGGRTGLMGEAGPEAIVPLTRRNGKLGVEASPVNVSVNNYSSGQVITKPRPDGGIDIDIIEQQLATRVARGGSMLDSAMQRGYGLRRPGR